MAQSLGFGPPRNSITAYKYSVSRPACTRLRVRVRVRVSAGIQVEMRSYTTGVEVVVQALVRLSACEGVYLIVVRSDTTNLTVSNLFTHI
jgi:hypothetical protein